MLDIKSSGYMKDVINSNEARANMFECVFHLPLCKHRRKWQTIDVRPVLKCRLFHKFRNSSEYFG